MPYWVKKEEVTSDWEKRSGILISRVSWWPGVASVTLTHSITSLSVTFLSISFVLLFQLVRAILVGSDTRQNMASCAARVDLLAILASSALGCNKNKREVVIALTFKAATLIGSFCFRSIAANARRILVTSDDVSTKDNR